MSGPVFKLGLRIPRTVTIEGLDGVSSCFDRERFSQWMWEELAPEGLLGVHEGTLLTAEAASKGLETESWAVDAAEAPRERDWVGGQESVESELYFEARPGAERAAALLRLRTDAGVGEIIEQEAQDWDAQWKAAFLGDGNGVHVPPFWRIIPPWVEAQADHSNERLLRINPGAGFGTGTHETTQLCLEAIGGRDRAGARALDFGSGSGILAAASALLGAQVDAVEIDPLAIDNARENARLNSVEARICFSQALPQAQPHYALVIANILRPVLLEFAEKLVERLEPGRGELILSGLIESDVAEVSARFSALLRGRKPQVRSRGEWRALVWQGCPG